MLQLGRNNFDGQLTFLEDNPFDPELNISDVNKIVQENVIFGFHDAKLYFEIKLIPSFFNEIVNNEHINEVRAIRMEFGYDGSKYSYVCDGYDMTMRCDLFKNNLTFDLLGYLYPSNPNGMPGLKKFYVYGSMKKG